MPFLKDVADLIRVLGAWAASLEGFLILCALAAVAYSGYQLIKHLTINVRGRRDALAAHVMELKGELALLSLDFEQERLDCREDSLKDSKFITTLLTIASKYQIAVIGATGGNRQVPPEISELGHDLSEIRKRLHDETNARVMRVADAKRRVAELKRLQEATKQ